ncbi:MAG TPA: hypothetical protein VMH61_06780 [Candidatus Acidoferrales bacterium]|nr:hypothetical protein [Candidatus Acidoferrales bacterium]
MRAFVFTDSSLARHAGQFVWLAINREKAQNSAFCRRYPVVGIPAFFVLDPSGRTVRLNWLGGLTVGELHTLLDDVRDHRNTPPALLAKLAAADSLYGASDWTGASRAYRAVLAAAPPDWRGYPRVVESLQTAMSTGGDDAGALALARETLQRLGRSPSALNVAAGGLGAATSLPDSVPGRVAALAEMAAATHALVTDTSFATAADDRSGAYIALIDARDAVHDSAGVRQVAGEWSAFLDGQAERAKTPEERAVFDSHRLSAYLQLGEPEKAVPMLLQSEHDMPGDYNPPARLAIAYKAMKRWDDALAASDRAMALAYGPRKLLLYDTRVDIERGRGDLTGARRTLAEEIAYARALPEEQRSPARLAALQKKLDALPAN